MLKLQLQEAACAHSIPMAQAARPPGPVADETPADCQSPPLKLRQSNPKSQHWGHIPINWSVYSHCRNNEVRSDLSILLLDRMPIHPLAFSLHPLAFSL